MGQNINDMDSFDNAGLELADSDDDGVIDANVVNQLHFGGFNPDEDPNTKKSRNEIMKEVIAKSKMHKRERQQQKEHDLDLVEQVDGDLDLMRSLLAPMNPPVSEGRMKISSDRLQLINGDITRPSEIPETAQQKKEYVEFQAPFDGNIYLIQ
jgi:nucleolar protein 14